MTGRRRNERAPLIGFKRHLRLEVISGDAVYLMSEHGVAAVRGPHLAALAPLLDGTRDLPTLLEAAAPLVPPAQVAQIVGQLTRCGLLGHRPPRESGAEDPAARAYWDLAGTEAPDGTGTVRIVTVGDLDDSGPAAACRRAGVTVTESGAPATLDLVLCTDYLDPRLAAVDAAHRDDGRPWLLAKLCGTTLWVGPVFRPGTEAGACWNCLAHRLRAHRCAEVPVRVAHVGATVDVPHAGLPATRALGAQIAALECVKWLAGHRGDEHDRVVTLDTLNLTSRSHPLTRRPQCPECGDPSLMARQAARPVVLTGRHRTVRTSGGHRALSAQAMLDRYGHLVDPVTGVVKEIRRDRRGPELLNVYRAGHNLALTPRHMTELNASLRQESSGKGRTALDARVGALCEALERISGRWQGDESVVRGSLRTLGPDAVHPADCQLWHERQIAERARWNAGGHPFHQVAEAFDPDAELDWSPVWSLTRERHVLLPAALLYYHAPDAAGRRMVRADSNGCAAGSSLEDAALQGLLELVERDAVALWWYNRTRQPGVDLAAFDDHWTSEVLRTHRELHREVWALDLTSDLGVPVFAALSRRTDRGVGAPEDIVFGFGAHPDPAIALSRAVTELNQMLPPVLDSHPDGTGYACADKVALHWWRTAARDAMPYLAPDPGVPARTPLDYGWSGVGDVLEEFQNLRRTIESKGLEVCILDQTRPDLGLPVVRTLVPGLRHFWPRFAPGRLFDVPVSLGRLPEPTPYEGLNPIPLFV
ncbi:TOMM precursor leader peptide-binding protein [Streptomyces sp. NPDC056194]|uniref:TOMM precursor leader peptide-binding protein n=1 Tax=unclassified Streptomyces TaxID=2593676 RepID=UPI0035E1DBE1